MTTWTPIEKVPNTVTKQDLLIEDEFKLLIGEGYFLEIQAFQDTLWTNISKNTSTWTDISKST
jgi:hypothetical protein